MMKNTYMHPSIMIRDGGELMGKGIFAIQDIPMETDIAYVTIEEFIVYNLDEYYQFSQLDYKIENMDKKILFSLYLAFIFAHKRTDLKLNKEYTYLQNLPSNFDNLICWSDQQLQMLQNQELTTKIRSKKLKINSEYSKILQNLIEIIKQKPYKHEPRFFRDQAELKDVKNQLVFKMYAAIQSRNMHYSWQCDTNSIVGALIPNIDMLNHCQKSTIKVELRKQKYYARTICDVKKGEQLFAKYGDYTNQNFLEWYGFMPGEQQAELLLYSDTERKALTRREYLAQEYKRRRKLSLKN